jgi:hypothetical protein
VSFDPKNMLVFPFGIQRFSPRENIKAGEDVRRLPGWNVQGQPGMVNALIAETPASLVVPGTQPLRWLDVQDHGLAAWEGISTPILEAPAPWTYAWTVRLRIAEAPPVSGMPPTLAIQHVAGAGLPDAFGLRFEPDAVHVFVTEVFGEPTEAELFNYSGATALGEWISVRFVADLTRRTLTSFVNGTEVSEMRTRLAADTDVTRLRMRYHGSGTGNTMGLQLDEIGVAFLNPMCIEDHTYDFETEDDFSTVLVNGQRIDGEFGNELTVSGSGGQGPAIFDTSSGGPNDPSQDMDLLISQGNALIVQTDAAGNPPIVGDVFPRPNDDEDGGSFTFGFNRPCTPLTIDLLDIDAAGNEGMVVVLTDFSALTRTFTVPANWTGDFVAAEPGVGTLDLQTLANQAGFASVATAVEDPGFDASAVVSMSITLGGSGGVDNIHVIIPCVVIDYETEDDFTPTFSGTALVNGQDISTGPEFGVEMAIASAGPNVGAAIFDSSPAGPNNPGPDLDLLVGLGNILILQNNLAATQTVPGIFDVPNDDTQGGSLFFTFPNPVHVHQIDLIDVDEEEDAGVTVTLTDSSNLTRTFTAPIAWTEDRLNDGPPAFRTLDLDTLAAQPGFAASATAVEDPGFDSNQVVSMTVDFGGAQATDNFCFCP